MARRRRRGYSRRSRGGNSFGVSNKFLLGAVAGYLGLDDAIPHEITLGLAVVPARTQGLGTMARGVIAGEMLRSFSGKGVSASPGGAV